MESRAERRRGPRYVTINGEVYSRFSQQRGHPVIVVRDVIIGGVNRRGMQWYYPTGIKAPTTPICLK